MEFYIANLRTPNWPDFRRRSPFLVREDEPLSGLLLMPASSLLVLWRVRLLSLWLDLLLCPMNKSFHAWIALAFLCLRELPLVAEAGFRDTDGACSAAGSGSGSGSGVAPCASSSWSSRWKASSSGWRSSPQPSSGHKKRPSVSVKVGCSPSG
jgi:hypothetical protein